MSVCEDLVAPLDELGIVALHQIDDGIGGTRQEGLFEAEQLAVAHRAAQHAAENVAAPSVVGLHAVGGEEDERAPMIGDDAQRAVVLGSRAIGGAGEGREGIEDRAEEIGLEDGVFAPAAPSRAARGPCRCRCCGCFSGVRLPSVSWIELHEHEVPDLEIALAAVAAGAAVGVAAA